MLILCMDMRAAAMARLMIEGGKVGMGLGERTRVMMPVGAKRIEGLVERNWASGRHGEGGRCCWGSLHHVRVRMRC